LYLKDGSHPIEGHSFGASVNATGEVVFNTGMVGYPEALTDPSYRGQILVLTYPLIGNYGVPDETLKDEHGLPRFFESNDIHISGLIVSSYSWQHSHWAAQKSLSKWLCDNKVPAMYGVDTRALTKRLREHGTIQGLLEVVSEK
jgi:carbamoyl-phosphate synthase small subunit